MRLRHIVLTAAALSVLATGACNRDASASAAPATTTAPATSAPHVPKARKPTEPPPLQKTVAPMRKVRAVEAPRLSPRGLGPYTAGTGSLGLKLGDLLADYHQDAECPNGLYYGRGVKKYHSPYLTFTAKFKLLYIDVDDTAVATTAGVRVGTTYATVKRLHPEGRQYTNQGVHAWVVKQGSNALLIGIGDNGRVDGFEAGDAETVLFRFTDGEGC
jgi:hypothetical protein